MVVAEELGARWSDVDVLQSPIDEKTFGGPNIVEYGRAADLE